MAYVAVAIVHGQNQEEEYIRIEYLLPWDKCATLASQETHRAFLLDQAQRIQYEGEHQYFELECDRWRHIAISSKYVLFF